MPRPNTDATEADWSAWFESRELLREQYWTASAPPCHICGEVMQIASIGGGETVYACDPVAYYEETGKAVLKPGRERWADQHYAESRRTFNSGDGRVIRLIDSLEVSEALAVGLRDILASIEYSAGIGMTATPHAKEYLAIIQEAARSGIAIYKAATKGKEKNATDDPAPDHG